MQWEDCFSSKRTGDTISNATQRTSFQRDYDRIIFSSSFRRLQNKTQVFPLPGTSFVHNRLTHSLEVASVGRSFGSIIGEKLAKQISTSNETAQTFYQFDLSNVIASACLAHDIGNPAFGHSGEKAISNYFIENGSTLIEGTALKDYFSDAEWLDLTTFEGNANAIRILTQQFQGKSKGGMQLTYTTLASLIKYPCEANAIDKSKKHLKKFGFFQSEKDIFLDIAGEMQMIKDQDSNISFKRHPFVYLVEAADDICYRIMDMEDAYRLGIIQKSLISEAFLQIIKSLSSDVTSIDKVFKTYKSIGDHNESISYLRAKTISTLVGSCTEEFMTHEEEIRAGLYNNTLIDAVEDKCVALKEIIDVSVKNIYQHHSVVEIEIAGYHVMSHLLGLFVPSTLRKNKLGKDKMALSLIPDQFKNDPKQSPYQEVMRIVDLISGMTDLFATELYRKTTGIEISKHN